MLISIKLSKNLVYQIFLFNIFIVSNQFEHMHAYREAFLNAIMSGFVLNHSIFFQSKSLKLCEEVLQVQSDNDLLKKKNEDFEIELEKCQRHLQDSQRNIEKLTANLEAFNTRETQWHQTEMKYKTELQQLQTKLGQMQMELSCVSTELKLANAVSFFFFFILSLSFLDFNP